MNFVLTNRQVQQRCIDVVSTLRTDESQKYVVTIKPQENNRTVEQNKRMWAMLTDIANQVEWYGKKRTPENWKDMLTAALIKAEAVPGIDGGFVVLGLQTSRMSTKRMSDLMELMAAFGAEKGVRFTAKDE